jgi:hypothetical protein
MMAPVAIPRIIAIVLVLLGGALVGCSSSGSEPVPIEEPIDWSFPQELPPPKYEDYRSEFVSDEEGSRFYPRSGRVTPSTAYVFDTGHCGLTFLADFDGSFWEPVTPAGMVPDFFINQDVGAIALVDPHEAEFRSSDGTSVRLLRVDGPVTTFGCD